MDDETDYEEEMERPWVGEEPAEEPKEIADEEDDPEQVRKECLELFQTQDFIMEPDIINHLKRFDTIGSDYMKNLFVSYAILDFFKSVEIQNKLSVCYQTIITR